MLVSEWKKESKAGVMYPHHILHKLFWWFGGQIDWIDVSNNVATLRSKNVSFYVPFKPVFI